MKLCVGNKLFENRDIHKFMWMSGVDDRNSLLLSLIVVQEEDKIKPLGANVIRGAGREITEHHLGVS